MFIFLVIDKPAFTHSHPNTRNYQNKIDGKLITETKMAMKIA